MESGELSIIASNECFWATTGAAFTTGILLCSTDEVFLNFPSSLLVFLLLQLPSLIRIAFCVDAVTS